MIYTQRQLAELIRPIAEKYHVPAVYLFGSYARGEATELSDIDLLIDTAGTEIKSLLHLAAVGQDLETATGKRVDLITMDSLEQESNRPSTIHFRESLKQDKIKLFPRD